MDSNILFFMNEGAGPGTVAGLLPDIIDAAALHHNMHCEVVKLKLTDDAVAVGKMIHASQAERIVACGGDGTVNLLGQHLVGTKRTLGIVPVGSSNALAKNLNLPLDTVEAVNVAIVAEPISIDTLKINGKHCLHVCDVGINASLVRRFNTSQVRGMFTYARFLLAELLRWKTFPYRIEANGKKYSGDAFSITITNARIYGTMASINPEGILDDGMFEIAIIKPFPPHKLLRLCLQLFRKTLHLSPHVRYVRARQATLWNYAGMEVHIDGESVPDYREMQIEVVHNGLKVAAPALLPPTTPGAQSAAQT